MSLWFEGQSGGWWQMGTSKGERPDERLGETPELCALNQGRNWFQPEVLVEMRQPRVDSVIHPLSDCWIGGGNLK